MSLLPIKKTIENRRVVVFIIVLLGLLGLFSYYIIPKQENPDFNVPIAVITTYYPGASALDVESLITRKIEEELIGLEGSDYFRSFSRNNLSSIVLYLENNVDAEEVWQDLRQKMNDFQRELPKEAKKIEINTDLAETAGFILSISSRHNNYEQLVAAGEKIKKELSKISGISKLELLGEPQREIKVEVDLAKLNTSLLSLEDIANILKVQNLETPIGSINNDGVKLNINVSRGFNSIENVENVIIDVSKDSGAIVRLKDIAQVYWDVKDSNYIIKHNGSEAILLAGYFKEDKNIVPIGQEIEDRLTQINKDLPSHLEIDKILFQPHDVANSIDSFMYSLLWGMVFVILVVFLGMGLRNAIVVSVAVPLSILISFIAMNFLDIKIHQVSIAALIIVLGMLVDNSIVISDSIQRRLDDGEDRFIACVKGTEEVAIPVFTATLTTIAAFTPLLFLQSVAGEFIASLPQIVIIALAVSFLIAIFVVPPLAYIFFKKSAESSDRLYYLRKVFYSLLDGCFRRKGITLVLLLVVLLTTGYLGSLLGLEFFPKADKDVVHIDINTEMETDITKTEDLVEEIFRILEEHPEVTSYTGAIGRSLPKFYYTMDNPASSSGFAQVMVSVNLDHGSNTMTHFAHSLQKSIDEKIVGGKATVKILEQGDPIGAPIQVRIVGENIDQIEKGAEIVKNLLTNTPGTINVTDDISNRVYEYYVNVDFPRASFLGINNYDIQRELAIALSGTEATVLRDHNQENPILVKGNIKQTDDLYNLGIKSSATGNKILLRQISNIELQSQLPTIKKYNGDQTVTVFSDVMDGVSSIEVQNKIKQELEKMDLQGLMMVFDGEEKRIKDNFGDVGILAFFAVAMIYLILFIQFKSATQPLVVLLTIPLSVIGSIVGLTIFKQALSFTALLGIVSLIGIVVNNAIVLIDLINKEKQSGKDIEIACKSAVLRRFRPIFLGTATTIMGLTPLALSGSNLFVPMSLTLIFGLLISTLLTLVIIPMIYSIFENKQLWRNSHVEDFN